MSDLFDKVSSAMRAGWKAAEDAQKQADAKATIKMSDLVNNRITFVRHGGKLYRVTVAEVESTK